MRSYASYKRCVCKTGMPHADARFYPAVAAQLKMASVPSRMKILLLLIQSPHCVCDLMTHTKLSQTLLSHHLSDLAAAELVKSEKHGAFTDYSLTVKGRRLVKTIEKLAL